MAAAICAEELIFNCALAADAAKDAGVKQANDAAKGIRAALKTALASRSRYAERTALHALDRFCEVAPTSADVVLLLKIHWEDLRDLRSSFSAEPREIQVKPLWPENEPTWIGNPH